MQTIPREILENNWIVLLFILGLLLLGFLKAIQPSRLLGYSVSFFTKGFIEKRAEEKPKFFSAFHGFLFFFTTLTIAIFIYALQLSKTILSFALILALVNSYFIIRYAIDYSLAAVLNITEYVRYFIFSKSGYLYNLAIWLFPILIFYFFGFKNNYFLWFSFCLLLLLRFALVFYNNKNLITKHFFYFILYLCALEIAPLLILFKLLKQA